jgi:hypothetical protein
VTAPAVLPPIEPASCDRCPIETGGPDAHPSIMLCDTTGVHRTWCTVHLGWRPCIGEPLDCGFLSL